MESKYTRYNHSAKGIARSRRRGAERAANGKKRELNASRGDRAAEGAMTRARRKAYELELFKDAPEKRIPVEGVSRVVILSDMQIPYEDGQAVDQALQVIDSINADLVILNGDIDDCYAISDFDKDPDKAQAAIPETVRRVQALLDCLEGRRVIWLDGNHEDRWRRLLWGGSPTGLLMLREYAKAAGIDIDLVNPRLSFEKLHNLTERGILHYPYSHRLYLAENNLVVTHGKYVSRHSGQSAKRTMEWLGRSCVVGHTHRMGNHLVTQDGVMYGAWENGCLCQLEPEYDDAPNWQQGFSVVKVNGPEFHVIQVPIIRRAGQAVAVYHGEAS